MDGMENLNLDDLDVEELERRVEMASAAPTPQDDGGICVGIYWSFTQVEQT